jgi:AhpD family alkylhydroperoxidase
MKTRLLINELEPEAYTAMVRMEKYLGKSSLGIRLAELIKLRASQINGCAYCIEMHTDIAMKEGESQKKLFAVAAWKESPLFTERERAALAMTDEITLISKQGLSDQTYDEAKKHYTENEIAQMIMLIGAINVWNRIAISTHLFYE